MQYPVSWLKGTTLGESIASQLRLRIINGEIPHGEILSENRIATDFGTSRSPVREALKLLSSEGLITLQRMGVQVAGLSLNNIEELVDVRCLIESFAWQRIGADYSEIRISTLNQIIDKMQLAAKHRDIAEFAHQQYSFHEYIITEAKHTRILHLWNSISGIVKTIMLLTARDLLTQEEDKIQYVIHKHQWLLESLETREPAIIQERIETYFTDSRNTFAHPHFAE
ncbi:GntR family transcriptional regulator [Paenibacillus segetis]|uniref:GntR family transcriptional regulator n=1 Tax=Paenibacillus segetis TaxID=1325360 RepID=A0ABQ1YKR4_9BACL|nr:GntR family transcriptional regulator [Paenibacillus segetis]